MALNSACASSRPTPGRRAADRGQRADVTTVEGLGRLKRQPDFRTEREPHTLGHHAHDRRRLAVDAHDAADDFGVRPIAIPPYAIADDRGRVRAAPAVRGEEIASQQDRLAQQAERVRGDARAVQRLRRALPVAQAHAPVDGERGETAERGRFAPVVLEVGERHALVQAVQLGARPDVDDAAGIFVGQAADEDRVNHRADRHVEADAQFQRRDGQRHEGSVSRQTPERVSEVARDILAPPRAARVAAQLLRSDRRRRTRGAPVGYLPLDVIAQLAVELAFEPVTVPQPLPPGHRALPPAVRRIRPTASASRAQLSVCSCSCARPFGVSR